MKEINGQLYGYSYELNSTTEADLTTCYAVDSGKIFIAYGGVWYEQPSFWAAQLSPSASDEYGYSYELGRRVADADLQIFNALDTGDRYVSFQGRWYKQPIAWSAPASGGGGGGGSGVLVVTITTASDGETKVCDKTAGEMAAALENGGIIFRTVISGGGISGYQYTPLMSATIADGVTYSFVTGFDTVVLAFAATSASEYPVSGRGPK